MGTRRVIVGLLPAATSTLAVGSGYCEGGLLARVSQLQLAQPVLTLPWSALFVGERIDAPTATATLFVIACVLVTLKTRVRVPFAVPEAS